MNDNDAKRVVPTAQSRPSGDQGLVTAACPSGSWPTECSTIPPQTGDGAYQVKQGVGLNCQDFQDAKWAKWAPGNMKSDHNDVQICKVGTCLCRRLMKIAFQLILKDYLQHL